MTTDKLDKLDLLLYYPVPNERNYEAEYFDSIDVSQIDLDGKLKRKCMRTIARCRRQPKMNALKKGLTRVAMVMLGIFVAGTISVVSIAGLRNAIWNAVVEWYDDYVSVKFESNVNDTSDENNSSGGYTEVPSTIETVYKPTALPEGVEEVVVMEDELMIFIGYYFENNWLFTYRQGLLSDEEKMLDNEGVFVDEKIIGGHKAKIFQSDDKNMKLIIWNDGQYVYSILSNKDMEFMVNVAESVSPIYDNK